MNEVPTMGYTLVNTMNYTLAGLIDIDQTQKLLEKFFNAEGVQAAIINLEGVVIVSSPWHRLCADFHRKNEMIGKRCIESDTILADKLLDGNSFSLYGCLNGLTDAASPIKIEGLHVANLFIGQFFMEKPDVAFFRHQAKEHGFNESVYLEALSEIPIIAQNTLPSILSFLTSFAEMIASLGLKQLRQLKTEKELRKSRHSKAHDLLEMRVQERTAELRESEERLRCLSARLLAGQEEERKMIGREIHDSIGSSLAAVIFSLESARSKALQLDGEQIQDLLEIPISITKKAIEETRRIHTGMRPPILDDLGLIAAIAWYCRGFQQSYPQIHIEQEVSLEENEIPDPLKIVIFRILQETLNNIAKYSKAEFVNLSIIKNGGTIELAVEDSGIGFDLNAILSRADCSRGLGLTSMRERASLAGGNLIIQSIPGEGTTIRGSWTVQS